MPMACFTIQIAFAVFISWKIAPLERLGERFRNDRGRAAVNPSSLHLRMAAERTDVILPHIGVATQRL